jgi:hypothetical protein
MQIEVIGAFIIGLTVGLQFLLRAKYADLKGHVARLEDKLNERESVPYALRNWSEDVLARNTNSRIAMQNLRDLVEVAQWNLEVETKLLGQIRNGEWDKDQPAASSRPPQDSTRGNGNS